MRFAYADPPYPRQSARYKREAAAAGRVAREVNHPLLIAYLCDDYPDGWALSTSSTALQSVLALCPEDVRIMAWVKTFAIFKPNVNPGYCWEPVIVRGGRKRTREQVTLRDWCIGTVMQHGFTGAKPPYFTHWVREALNVQEDDTLDDLFPGSGAVTRALAQSALALSSSEPSYSRT